MGVRRPALRRAKGEYFDPDAGRIRLDEFAARDKAIAIALSELAEQALGPLRAAMDASGCAMDVPWTPSGGPEEGANQAQKGPATRTFVESGRRESNSRSQLGKLTEGALLTGM